MALKGAGRGKGYNQGDKPECLISACLVYRGYPQGLPCPSFPPYFVLVFHLRGKASPFLSHAKLLRR